MVNINKYVLAKPQQNLFLKYFNCKIMIINSFELRFECGRVSELNSYIFMFFKQISFIPFRYSENLKNLNFYLHSMLLLLISQYNNSGGNGIADYSVNLLLS